MLRRPNCLLTLVLVCGVGRAGEPVADGPPFIAHLPQGTVELVGVTDDYRPTKRSRWWRPDGSAAPIGPFRALQKYHKLRILEDEKVRTFLVRFENLPADASIDPVGGINFSTAPQGPVSLRGTPNFVAGEGTSARNPAQFSTGAPSWDAGSYLWSETAVYDVVGAQGVVTRHNARPSHPAAAGPAGTYARYKRVPHYDKMFAAKLAGSAQTTDLRVGVSMGAWETVISRKPNSAGASSFSRDSREWTVTFHRATTVRNTTRVPLKSSSYTYGQWNKRLVAVASDGSEHASSIDGPQSGLDGSRGVAVFRNLPLSSIKEFRLQVRPFRCVEFDNISLQLGQKAQVAVVSYDDPTKTENRALEPSPGFSP